jgi:pyruvate kinase
MLSGETAQGQFPIEAVTAMATINKESELFFDYDGVDAYVEHANLSSKAKEFAHKLTSHNKMTGVGRNKQTKFEATICFGHSTDEEIIAASAFRPAAPVIFVTNNKQQLTKYGIYYGIYMFYAENGSEEETVQKILNQYSLTSEKTLIIRD